MTFSLSSITAEKFTANFESEGFPPSLWVSGRCAWFPHLDVSHAIVERAIEAIREVLA